MIRFTIFGVPVEIQPMFWLTGAFLGGAINARTKEQILGVLVFMVIMAISILTHELGHALVGRRLGGGYATITLWGLGGLAFNQGGRFTRSGNFWRVAAGPGAGFALLILVVLLLCIGLGAMNGLSLTTRTLFGTYLTPPSEELMSFIDGSFQRRRMISAFLHINFWWGVLNLLPVLPLDGGRIAELFVKPQKLVYQIGITTGAAMAAFALLFLGSTFTAIMFGYLAYQNYQMMQENRWG